MWEVAAEFDVPIVVPFLSGPDPRRMQHVERDPVETILEFFADRLADADRYGRRDHCILDPGTGFAPPNWPWEERYRYQKQVYSNLGALRRFGRPLYIALPWKETAQHDELLELVVRQQPETRGALSAEGAGVRGARPRSHERAAGVNSSVPTEDSQPDGQRSGATSNSGASTKRSA